MSKLVIFYLGKGNLQNGFSDVTVQLREDGKTKWWQFNGSLPAAPIILDRYRRWQLLYKLLYESLSTINKGLRQPQVSDEDIKFDEVDVNYVSLEDFHQVCQQLKDAIDFWLDTEDFRQIDRQLRRQLSPNDAIRVIIQTEDNNLRKIPWHLWRFFSDYPKAEVALSALDVEPVNQAKNSANQVRILVILGDSTGIDIKADERELKKLPDTKVEFLAQPQRQELNEQLRNEQGWDILFFAGHGSSQANGETGYMHINPNDKLTIEDLKYALVYAIERGLQFAIFNSCDGLGLAKQLNDLYIPQIIVMREPVPDRVAQFFLKYFLKKFVEGNSFYLAVREARQYLQGIESDCPGASWLPMICQNPAEVPPTWEQLRNKNQPVIQPSPPIPPPPPPPPSKPKMKTALVASVIVTSLLMGLRWLGTLERLELSAYDQLMTQRPPEKIDDRILVVEADQEDVNRYGNELPDATIAQVFEILEQYKPRAIGIDMFRPMPRGSKSEHEKLITQFKKNKNIIAGCLFDVGPVPPPPELSGEPFKKQVGFFDLYTDHFDNDLDTKVVRRQALWLTPSNISQCPNSHYAFSLLLANQYFEAQQKPMDYRTGELRFGTTIFKRLAARTGGYQRLGGKSSEILINFRPPNEKGEIAETVKLRDIINKQVDQKLIQDKVVLIGVTASSVQDPHYTPYGEKRGLWIHTQMVSAILSAVEGERKLLWVLPQWGDIQWGDALFVWGWAFIGGLLAWRIRSLLYLGLTGGVATWFLYKICLVILTSGGWMPLIPSVLSLVFTGGTVVIYIASRSQQQQ